MTNPPDPKAFNAAVYEIARKIPVGRVATYGQIATMLPPPEGVNLPEYEAQGARWVGGAMAACGDDVPWQRVINAQGKISVRKGGGPVRQRALLEAEGVEFDENERVDLAKYRWRPEGEDEGQVDQPRLL